MPAFKQSILGRNRFTPKKTSLKQLEMVIGMNMFVQKCSKIQATGYFSRKSSIFVLKISTDLLDLFHQDYYPGEEAWEKSFIVGDTSHRWCNLLPWWGSPFEVFFGYQIFVTQDLHQHLKWIYNRIKAIIQGTTIKSWLVDRILQKKISQNPPQNHIIPATCAG